MGHPQGAAEERALSSQGVADLPSTVAEKRRITRPRNCTFTASDWEILSRHWFAVARIADLSAKPISATLLDVGLVVYRTSEGVRVARDLCPHRGVPLSTGWMEGDVIVCPYHGLRYDPNGRCRAIPSQPNVEPSDRFTLTMLPSVERYGLVWTRIDSSRQSDDIPAFPYWEDADYQQIVPPFVDIAAAPGRQMEGFLDVAHFAWVHNRAFADRDNPVVPTYKTKSTNFGLRMEYWSNVSNYPSALQHLAPPDFQWLRIFDVYPPFTATLTVHFPREDRLHIMNAASPVSARKTRLFVPVLRNFDTTGSLDDVFAFNAQVFAEDQAIVETQEPKDLPLDLDGEAHFAADRTAIAYRRLLKGMQLSLQQVDR